MGSDFMQSAIAAFGASRRTQLAAEVARIMSERPSRAIYGPDHAHETLWQEYCHAHRGGEEPSALALWSALIEPYADGLVAALPEPEARLVAIAAQPHASEGLPRSEEHDATVRYVLEEVAALAQAAARDALAGTEYTPTLWRISPDGDDAVVLDRLMMAIRNMVFETWYRNEGRGEDLIGAGEALDALERIGQGEEIEVNVEVTVGFGADENFSEGVYLSLHVCEDYISLDRTQTTYSADVGGDHHSERVACLYPEGQFSESGVEEWLGAVGAVLREERARLTVSRHHV